MNKAFRFVHKLVDFFPEIEDGYKSFKEKNKFLPELRNIYEHFEEYVMGKGFAKDKNYVLDEKRSSLSDATGISVRMDEETGEFDLVIGNRVSIRQAVLSARRILVQVILIREKSNQV